MPEHFPNAVSGGSIKKKLSQLKKKKERKRNWGKGFDEPVMGQILMLKQCNSDIMYGPTLVEHQF